MRPRPRKRRLDAWLLAALAASVWGCDARTEPAETPAKTDPAAAADPAAGTETIALDITGMT